MIYPIRYPHNPHQRQKLAFFFNNRVDICNDNGAGRVRTQPCSLNVHALREQLCRSKGGIL